MRTSEVSLEEILFLKEAMKNAEFDKERSKHLTNYGGWSLYFNEYNNWTRYYSRVPSELVGVILGYRWAKKYRNAQ